MTITYLEPPLDLDKSNLTLNAKLSPNSNSIAIFPSTSSITSASTSTSNSLTKTTTALSRSTGGTGIVYFANFELNNKFESREFIIETFTLFNSLQKIAKESSTNNGYNFNSSLNIVEPVQIKYFNRISRLYREILIKQFKIIAEDKELDDNEKLLSQSHHATLHGILSLAELLYLPFDGTGDGVVGEEILDFVNTVDRAPSAEEGQELADLSRPWEHVNFWPYIYRCILRGHLLSVIALLQLIQTHKSPFLQSLVKLPISLLESFPRSTQFTSESLFLSSVTKWKQSLKRTIVEIENLFSSNAFETDSNLGGDKNEEERLDWEAGFRCLIELIEGREKRILEASEDWREALGAWGIWVNPGGRREGLPEIMNKILKFHPVDSTLPSELVQASLILGDVPRALQQSNLISIWLVTHLADLLEKVQVIQDPTTSASSSNSDSISLRDHFVLNYSDTLLSDPNFWKINVEYLSTTSSSFSSTSSGSGESLGRDRIRRILLSVDLSESEVESVGSKDVDMEVEVDQVEGKGKGKGKVVDDVLRVCAEFGMDEVLKSVCKVYSEQLISKKRFGEAISYCVRAGDGKRITRITERILEEYITNGQEAFIYHVDSIPTSLLRPNSTPLSFNPTTNTHEIEMDEDLSESGLTNLNQNNPYSSRLNFLARYRDFFALYARGDRLQAARLLVLLLSSGVAPKSFYAVLLLDVVPLLKDEELLIPTSDAYELLRCLEEITSSITTSKSGDIYNYLDSLARIVTSASGKDGNSDLSKKDKDKEIIVIKQLDVCRVALAKYLGRCYLVEH